MGPQTQLGEQRYHGIQCVLRKKQGAGFKDTNRLECCSWVEVDLTFICGGRFLVGFLG